jgi:hypothetical protein
MLQQSYAVSRRVLSMHCSYKAKYLMMWQGIMTTQMSSFLFLVVGLSMAITPWLAAGGQLLASRFEQQDVRSLLPAENEVVSRCICTSKAMMRTDTKYVELSYNSEMCTVLARLMIYKTILLCAVLVVLGRYVNCPFVSIMRDPEIFH